MWWNKKLGCRLKARPGVSLSRGFLGRSFTHVSAKCQATNSTLSPGGSDRTYPHNLVGSGDELNASRSELRLCGRQDNRKELDELFVKDFFFYLCSSDLFHLYHLNNCNFIFCYTLFCTGYSCTGPISGPGAVEMDEGMNRNRQSKHRLVHMGSLLDQGSRQRMTCYLISVTDLRQEIPQSLPRLTYLKMPRVLSNTSESTILATESHERLQEQHFVSSPTASQVLEVGGNALRHRCRSEQTIRGSGTVNSDRMDLPPCPRQPMREPTVMEMMVRLLEQNSQFLRQSSAEAAQREARRQAERLEDLAREDRRATEKDSKSALSQAIRNFPRLKDKSLLPAQLQNFSDILEVYGCLSDKKTCRLQEVLDGHLAVTFQNLKLTNDVPFEEAKLSLLNAAGCTVSAALKAFLRPDSEVAAAMSSLDLFNNSQSLVHQIVTDNTTLKKIRFLLLKGYLANIVNEKC